MFNHEAKPARIYSYGAYEPDQPELFWEQARLAHQYKNKLCELERARREAYAQLRRQHCPQVQDLEAREADLVTRLEALRAEMRGRNARARGQATTPAQRDLARVVRIQLAEVRRALREARQQARQNDALAAASAELDEQAVAACKEARAASGLYWGNYLQIEKESHKSNRGAPPRFAAWRGEGKVVVQLQHGLSPEQAFACTDKVLRLEEVPWTRSHTAPQAGGARSRRLSVRVWLRVGSAVKGSRRPLWLRVPAVLHRPLPAGCLIKWAALLARRVGTRTEWQLQLTLTREEGFPVLDAAGDGMIGIDLGWRLLPDGSLRVAYWRGSDGAEGQLTLPPRWVTAPEHADGLRGIRDRMLDEIRPRLAGWLAARQGQLPGWLAGWPSLETLPHWRSSARLAALVRAWRSQRFAGDLEIFTSLEAWRKQEKHLYDWEASERRKAIARRDDHYRAFVARLRRRYRTAVIEDTDWGDLAARPQVEEGEKVLAVPSYHRQVAAPGRLAEVIREGFPACVRVPPAAVIVDPARANRRREPVGPGVWAVWRPVGAARADVGAARRRHRPA